MRTWKLLVLGTVGWACATLAAAAPRYQLEALPVLPGASLERIGAFNDQGQYAAAWRLPRREGLTLSLYTPGVGFETLMPSGLPVQFGGDFGAYDLNERGEVAALVNGNAYVLRAGGLGGPVPGTGTGVRYSGARGINDSGQVVGFREDPGAYRAYAYSPSTGFETLPFRNSLAVDINNAGQVLVEDSGSGQTRYWIHDLNTGGSTELAPELEPSPTARINDQGDVAFTVAPGDASRTYLWDDGAVTAIAGLAGSVDDEVLDFNNQGVVLGRSIRTEGNNPTWDPFLYDREGGTLSLSSLIDPAGLIGWQDGFSVSRINDNGDIIGHGIRLGERDWTPFILRSVAAPVPEPATWLMALLGTGVAFGARRRARGAAQTGPAAA
ncbi:PEP-CTERM sorting domain-containing protein [Rhizobacter sp. LjRoot28]|jgi:hypothetical protein|uniref:PEP-CTERM sorting domain-containing protein n=1 Tax=Rhizobacter sp. LjRoot28 TaxID=3342309 RepID=UPI003ED038BC